jgi:hypothetical protein
MSRAMLEAKVRDYLKKSAALEEFWRRPITAEDLQAEINRMAENTKDPSTLKELFEALGNNPRLITECLARPLLADRLIRTCYAKDERLHKETKAQAEHALASYGCDSLSLSPEGRFQRADYVLGAFGEIAAIPQERNGAVEIPLDAKHFEKQLAESPDEGQPAVLSEPPEAFLVIKTESKTAARLEVETLVFPKRDMDEWLKTVELNGAVDEDCPEGFGFTIPAVSQPTCSADSWAATSTGTNCPSGREFHTAVWSGSEMIIWGGYYQDASYHDNYTNTGGRYDPSSDAWTSTTTAGSCPSGRASHTAVWTGTAMIVWGGYISVSPYFTNTGASYSPANDSWTATPTGTTCPSARYYHTAIWTGKEMIIWGGYWPYYHYLNTGGRYNPSTNTWTPTSTAANCPSARHYHASVWTGAEMVIWGGHFYDGTTDYYLNTGARYNPSSDSWVLTSTGTGCPSGRYGHTAVWIGMEMVVWGGYDGGNYVNSGGQYFTGVPYEVPNTTLLWAPSGKQTLSWSAASCATAYRVYRGNPGELGNLPTGAQACIAYDGANTTTGATLTAVPSAGNFYWYLAVGYNSNGEGSAGQSSYGVRMINSSGQCSPAAMKFEEFRGGN